MRIVPLTPDLAPAWDAFCDAHPAAWFLHRSSWLAYEEAREGNRDLSFAVIDDPGRILKVVPFILEAGELQAGGEPVQMALSIGDLDVHMFARREQERLRDYHGVRRMRRQSWPGHTDDVLMIDRGWRDISWQTVVLDLSKPLTGDGSLWAGIRRSYRSPIKRAAERYRVVTGGPGCVAAAQRIHLRDAGRVTRPQRTWDLMAEWIDQGFAQCFVAETDVGPHGVPIGYVYCESYKGWAYWGSGATIAGDYVTHLLLWQAIQWARAKGDRWFEVGWTGHATDDKGRNIEAFKEGWSDDRWPVRAAEWRADDGN